MADPLMLVLRLLHIGAGVLWVGAALIITYFVTPALRIVGPDTEGKVMDAILRQRRLAQIILLATLVTVLAGGAMLIIDINRFGGLSQWFGTGFGVGITIGAVAAIVSFIIGPTLILPVTKRAENLGAAIAAQGGDPTAEQQAEMGAISRRLDKVLRYDSAFLVVAVAFMAIARYL